MDTNAGNAALADDKSATEVEYEVVETQDEDERLSSDQRDDSDDESERELEEKRERRRQEKKARREAFSSL